METLSLATRLQIVLTLAVIAFATTTVGSAQTTLWSEDFEGSWTTDWHVEAGTWEVGDATSGPGACHEGSNCAATVLAGNYADGVDTRLIRHTPFVVPTGESPRLRFWHWFSFNSLDRGEVQISADNGVTWDTLSTTYTATGSGVWTRTRIGLDSYAGQSVILAFHFRSVAPNTSTGWYIDEVTVESGVETMANPTTFEAGLESWYVEHGTWEVGVPTSGPAACHEGSSCAATVLGGNYADGTKSRLVSPPFVVPTGESPRLRFWHWFSLSSLDGGMVQISTDSGVTWDTLSTTYARTGSGVWTRARIGLDSYAGQSVMLAFHFRSDAPNTSTGWYIDEVTVESGVEPLTNPSTFEAGLESWYVEHGTWEVGVPTAGPTACHEGSSCVATVLAGNYHDQIQSRLVSPPFVVPAGAANPALRFWHWYSLSSLDVGEVQIRMEGTEDWIALSNEFAGTSSGAWTNYFASLAAYANQSVRLAFHFRSDAPNTSTGWYIDEVSIDGLTTGGPILSVNPSSVDFDSVSVGESSSVQVTVSNPGTEDLDVTSVALTGTNANQFSTDNSTFVLAPAASREITVSFDPTVGGPQSATLTIDSNAGSTNVALTGVGEGTAAISVDPLSIDFQTVIVGATATTEVTVTNTGAALLSVTSVSLTGTDAQHFDADVATFSLAPAASHGISVSFIPTAVGMFSATLSIQSDGGNIDVTLEGQADGGVANEADADAVSFAVAAPYPNPTATSTVVSVDLPNPAEVIVLVYDFLGREVRRINAGTYSAGRNNTIAVDFGDQSSGTYVLRVVANGAGQVEQTSRLVTILK